MPPIIIREKCIGCSACVGICPSQALKMGEDSIAELIVDKCKDDWSCVPICPTQAILKPPADFKVTERNYTEQELEKLGLEIKGTDAVWKKK